MNQLESHKKIEEFFKSGTEVADVNIARNLLPNEDAKRFFFSQADEFWLGWMWTHEFLDEIKKKAENTASYSYRLPELEYLTRMTEKNPVKVEEIIASVPVSEDSFNPEVVDRFLWITGSLPAEQVKKLTEKIRDEKWVYLMRNFYKTGYDFEKIVKKLVEKKESDAILELAEAILIVKSKVEISKKENDFIIVPFYVSNIDASGIFEALVNIQESHKERALKIIAGVMGEIIKLSEPAETEVFEYRDLYSLFDVDFFTLEIGDKVIYSYQEDIKKLAATIKKLIEKTIGEKCGDANEAKKLFEYINKLNS